MAPEPSNRETFPRSTNCIRVLIEFVNYLKKNWEEVLKSLVFDDMVESEVDSATDWTPGVGGHGAVLAFS